MGKVQKALSVNGPSFINVLAPCPRGWRFKDKDSMEIARLAVETCFWPLYEVERGTWKLTYKPKEKRPITDWTGRQGRFRHLMKEENKHVIDELQANVDYKWEQLLKRCEG